MPADGQGQAPAATPRTDPRASVVMAPRMSPVEKIEALLQVERPVQPGEKMVQPPALNPPAPVKAETPPPAEASAETPEPNAPDAPAQPADAPATEQQANQEVEGVKAAP